MKPDYELWKNLDKLHTTELGVERIKRNLSLNTDDVIVWCKTKTISADAVITRNGKNWYIKVDNCIITVYASSSICAACFIKYLCIRRKNYE